MFSMPMRKTISILGKNAPEVLTVKNEVKKNEPYKRDKVASQRRPQKT